MTTAANLPPCCLSLTLGLGMFRWNFSGGRFSLRDRLERYDRAFSGIPFGLLLGPALRHLCSHGKQRPLVIGVIWVRLHITDTSMGSTMREAWLGKYVV